jgi:hypothetical protein
MTELSGRSPWPTAMADRNGRTLGLLHNEHRMQIGYLV